MSRYAAPPEETTGFAADPAFEDVAESSIGACARSAIRR